MNTYMMKLKVCNLEKHKVEYKIKFYYSKSIKI